MEMDTWNSGCVDRGRFDRRRRIHVEGNGFRMMANAYGPGYFERSVPPNSPDAPRGYEDYRRYHMDGWGGGMPMMGNGYGYGYAPHMYGPFGTGFMLVGGLFHLLIPLGLLALVAYVFYQMGKRVRNGITRRAHAGCGLLPRRRVARR